MAFTRGWRHLPVLSRLKISTERANKTQGQELYDRMNRAVEAFGTNVAFKGLAFNPYLSLSLLYPSQSSHTTSCSTDGREVGGQLRWKHRRIGVAQQNNHFYGIHQMYKLEWHVKDVGRDEG